jgi:hypothetical protein
MIGPISLGSNNHDGQSERFNKGVRTNTRKRIVIEVDMKNDSLLCQVHPGDIEDVIDARKCCYGAKQLAWAPLSGR